MKRRMRAAALLAAAALALALAGCGGGSDSGSTAASGGGDTGTGAEPAQAAPNAEQGTTFVSLGNVSGLGMVLVDSNGMTLYDFQKDRGTESTCYGECAAFWPPLLTKGEPQPSNGADASLLGTTERRDGTTQVTYAGRPLYLFVKDSKPGEANGNDVDAFGAEWYALLGNGEEAGDGGGEADDDSGGGEANESGGGGEAEDSGGGAYGY